MATLHNGSGPIQNAVLIAGPTASGKSALALEIARETGGVIVNTDAMQVYDVLRILTARPGDEDLEAASHELYGHGHPAMPYSVAAWLADVEKLAAGGAFSGKAPIFVGGTGLYFAALTLGLSEIPAIPPAIRDEWRARSIGEGAAVLHRLLAERDPEMAAHLRPTDGQRIVRALEVHDATGRSLAYWQQQRSAPLVDIGVARKIVLEPDRAVLAERIHTRFDLMLEQGAMEEVEALAALDLPSSLPAMKAIGVPELMGVLSGKLTLEQAILDAKTSTRQYAKRQMTWFRNQFGDDWVRHSGG